MAKALQSCRFFLHYWRGHRLPVGLWPRKSAWYWLVVIPGYLETTTRRFTRQSSVWLSGESVLRDQQRSMPEMMEPQQMNRERKRMDLPTDDRPVAKRQHASCVQFMQWKLVKIDVTEESCVGSLTPKRHWRSDFASTAKSLVCKRLFVQWFFIYFAPFSLPLKQSVIFRTNFFFITSGPYQGHHFF